MMQAVSSCVTSVHTRAIRRNGPEDAIFIIAAVETSNLTKINLTVKNNRPVANVRRSAAIEPVDCKVMATGHTSAIVLYCISTFMYLRP
jgi:alpha-galactosidase/6-phospho-beta-glucosidase family protein